MTSATGTAPEYTTTINKNTADDIVLYALWTPVCTEGKYLHIGNDRMCLYTTKRTNPSLAIKLDDTIYYGNMSPVGESDKTMTGSSSQKLHIKYDNTIYNVYDLTAQ